MSDRRHMNVRCVDILNRWLQGTCNFATGATCPDVISTISNGRYVSIQGDAATSPAPAVGTVLAVMCDPGYEQTRGVPYYECRTDGQDASWSGELFDVSRTPLCESECLNITVLIRARHSTQYSLLVGYIILFSTHLQQSHEETNDVLWFIGR